MEGSIMKTPKQIKTVFVSRFQLNPISLVHYLNKFSTPHITCTCSPTKLTGHCAEAKYHHISLCQVLIPDHVCRWLTQLQITSSLWKRNDTDKAWHVLCNVWLVSFEPGLNPDLISATRWAGLGQCLDPCGWLSVFAPRFLIITFHITLLWLQRAVCQNAVA